MMRSKVHYNALRRDDCMPDLPSPPKCPLLEDDCRHLSEVLRLRSENRELQQLVTTDTLTGLFNYRYFCQVLDTEMQRTRRTGRTTCLIMIDLDHFKAVNDRWGHEGGNVALKTAARVFRQELRQLDIVCRYGGEEFAVIVPQTGLPMAVAIAERIRRSLEQTPVPFGDQPFRLTASFGVDCYRYTDRDSAEGFVKRVDGWLYKAKEAGRNRVAHPPFNGSGEPGEVSPDERAALFSSGRE